jgi:hypothetical protein
MMLDASAKDLNKRAGQGRHELIDDGSARHHAMTEPLLTAPRTPKQG